ncbi:MAG: major capsid protein [Thermoplasmata archaeon]|nr:major capsid protein [Thermoplasmata archaeon]
MDPIATDQFSRFFMSTFDENLIVAVPQGFQAFFGAPGASQTIVSPDADTVEIDILRANGERLAAMVHRGMSSLDASREESALASKFTNIVRKYPLIEEKGYINSTQLGLRGPGEQPFSQRSRLDRNRSIARKIIMDLILKTIRTNEYLCSKSILTGQQPAIINTTNANLIYDFLRLATHFITVGTGWNQAGATIMDDIDNGCDLVEKDGNAEPNFMGQGADATDAMINNASFQLLADNRRIELIEVSTNNPVPDEYARFVSAGWIPRGRLRTTRGRTLWIFNYNKNYTDPTSGLKVRYMPNDQVFITDINARRDRMFGPPDRLPVTADEAAWYMEMFGFSMTAPPMPPQVSAAGATALVRPDVFFSDAYRSEDKKTVIMRTQNGPIYPTTQTDAHVTLSGLIT